MLDENLDPNSHEEVCAEIRALKLNRASGVDEIPGEFWKLVMAKGTLAAEWMVEFCDSCWSRKTVPDQWHLARVVAIL